MAGSQHKPDQSAGENFILRCIVGKNRQEMPGPALQGLELTILEIVA